MKSPGLVVLFFAVLTAVVVLVFRHAGRVSARRSAELQSLARRISGSTYADAPAEGMRWEDYLLGENLVRADAGNLIRFRTASGQGLFFDASWTREHHVPGHPRQRSPGSGSFLQFWPESPAARLGVLEALDRSGIPMRDVQPAGALRIVQIPPTWRHDAGAHVLIGWSQHFAPVADVERFIAMTTSPVE